VRVKENKNDQRKKTHLENICPNALHISGTLLALRGDTELQQVD
jgi:hypothetical protein